MKHVSGNVAQCSTSRPLPDRTFGKMTSYVNEPSQEAARVKFVEQNAMKRQMVSEHPDNRQIYSPTKDKEEKMDHFGGNAVLKKAQLDPLDSRNMENRASFNSKTVKHLGKTQIFPGNFPMNTAERRSSPETSTSRNDVPQRFSLQTQNTPYVTALETFSDWLYEWTPPERILHKLKMIGQMRNEIVRGWLLSVNIERPLPLYRSEKRIAFEKKDASVQTDSNLHKYPQHTQNKFTRAKTWLKNYFQRSRHSFRTTLCTGKRETKGKNQKDVSTSEDTRCSSSAKDQNLSRQETVTMETRQEPDINAMKRSRRDKTLDGVLESSQDTIKTREEFSDFKNYSTNTISRKEAAQSTTTLAAANSSNLREIEGSSLVCINKITTLTEDGATENKYWKGEKVNERISPRIVGTKADDNHGSNLNINYKIDFQSRPAPTLSSSLLVDDARMNDRIGRDNDGDGNFKYSNIYTNDVVREITGEENLSANNKIIPKLEKARANLLNMSRSFRSKIIEIDARPLVDREVKTTGIRSLSSRLPPFSESWELDDPATTKFGGKRRLRDANPVMKRHAGSSLRERLSSKLCESNKVHPKPSNVHLEQFKDETKTESLDKEELREMTDFIENMLQRQKNTAPNMEINNLLERQSDLNKRMTHPSTFLPCHRLELAFRETVRQKFAHHNHFRTDPLPKKPDRRQGCIGCQLVVSSELYGNS